MRKGKRKGIFRRIAAALLAVALILTAIPAISLRESQAATKGKYKWKVRIKVNDLWYNDPGSYNDVHFRLEHKDETGATQSGWSRRLGNDFGYGNEKTFELEESEHDPWEVTRFGLSCGSDELIIDSIEVWLPNGNNVGSTSIKYTDTVGIEDTTYWWKINDKFKRIINENDLKQFNNVEGEVHLNSNKYDPAIADFSKITVSDQFNPNKYNIWNDRSFAPSILWENLKLNGPNGNTNWRIEDIWSTDESSHKITLVKDLYKKMKDADIGIISADMNIKGTKKWTKDKETITLEHTIRNNVLPGKARDVLAANSLKIYRDIFSLELPENATTKIQDKFKTSALSDTAPSELSKHILDENDPKDKIGVLYINKDKVIFKTSLNSVYGQSTTTTGNSSDVDKAANGIINWMYTNNAKMNFCTLYDGEGTNGEKLCELKLTNKPTGSNKTLTFEGELPERYDTKNNGVTLSLNFSNEKQPNYNGNKYSLEIGKQSNTVNQYYSLLKVDNEAPTLTLESSSDKNLNELAEFHAFVPVASEQIYSKEGNNYESGKVKCVLSKKDSDTPYKIYESDGEGTAALSQQFPVYQSSGSDIPVMLKLGEALEGEFTLKLSGKDVAQNDLNEEVDVKLDNKAPEVKVDLKTNPRTVDNTRTMEVSFDISDYSKTGRVNYCFVRDGENAPSKPTDNSQIQEIPSSVSEGQWCFVKQNSLSGTTSTVLKIGKEEEFAGTLYYYTVDDFGNDSTDIDQKGKMDSTRIELYNKTGAGTAEFGVAPADEGKKAVKNYVVTPTPGENSKFCYYYENVESGVKTKLMDADELESNAYQPGSSQVVMEDGSEDTLDGQWSFVYYFENKSSGIKSEIESKTLTFDTKEPAAKITWETPDEARNTQKVHIAINDSSRVKNPWYKADKSSEKIDLPVDADGNVDHTVEVTADTKDKNKFQLVLGAEDENGHSFSDKALENSDYYIVSTPEAKISTPEDSAKWDENPILTDGDKVTITALTQFKAEDYQKLHAQVSYSLDGIIWNDWKDIESLSFTDGQYQGSLTFDAKDMKLYQGLNNIYARVRTYSGDKSPQTDASVPYYVSDTASAPFVSVYYDSKAPECMLEYENTSLTNGDVIATLTATDRLTGINGLKVEAGQGLIPVEDANNKNLGVYKYLIKENVDTAITVTDLTGNKTTVPVQVNWIDKEAPEITANAEPVTAGGRTDASIQVTAKSASGVRFALIPSGVSNAIEDGTIDQKYYDYFNSPETIPESEGGSTASRITMFATESGRSGQATDLNYDINMKGLNGTFRLAAEVSDPLGNSAIVDDLCKITMADSQPEVTKVSYSEGTEQSGEVLPDRNMAELTFNVPVFVISDSELKALQAEEPDSSLEQLCKKIAATKYASTWNIPVDKAGKITITYMDELGRSGTYELDTSGAVRTEGNEVKVTTQRNGETITPEAGKWTAFEVEDQVQVVLETDTEKHPQGEYLWIDDAAADLKGFTVNEELSVICTPEPMPEPSEEPTPEPSEEPTPEPSEEPTPEPSEEPTPEPSEEPIPKPSEEPTPEPSEEPTPQSAEEIGEVLQLSAVNNETFIAEPTGIDIQQEDTPQDNTSLSVEGKILYEKLVLDAVHGYEGKVRSVDYKSFVSSTEAEAGDSIQSHVYLLSSLDETAAQPPSENSYIYSARDKTNQSVTVKIPVNDAESGIADVITVDAVDGKEKHVYSSDSTITDFFEENGTRTYTIINGAGMTSQCTVSVQNINKEPITADDYSVEYYYTDYKGNNKFIDSKQAYRSVRAVVKQAGSKNLTVLNNMGSPEVNLYSSREFRYQVADEYGNTAEIPVSHELYDRTPPEITAQVLNENPTKDPISVEIQVVDKENGGAIAHCEAESVSDGGECGEMTAVDGETGVYNLTVGRSGKYMVRAYDLAGNYAETTFMVTNINADAPVMVGYTLSTESFTSGPVTATLQFKSGESLNERVKITKIEPVSGVTLADITFTDKTITFKNNGTVSVWFEDQYGNQNVGVLTVSNIVNKPPRLSANVLLSADETQATVTFSLLDDDGNIVEKDSFGRTLADITISSSILDYSNKGGNSGGKETYVTADKARLIATVNGVYQVTAFDVAGNTQKLGVIISGIDRASAKVKSVEWKYKYLSNEDNWSEKDGSGSHNVTEENDNGILLTSRQESKGQIINTPATNRKVEVTVVTDKPVTQVGAKKEASEKNSMDYTDDGTFSFNLQAKNKNITQYMVSVDLIDKDPPVLKLDNPELVFVENAKLKDDVYNKELLTAGLKAYDMGKDGEEILIDESEIKISYGDGEHVFNPDDMNKNEYNREKPYYITYSVKDAVGNETTLKQTITLIGKNDTVALINGRMPSTTNSTTVDNGTIAVTLKNHGGKSYIKYTKGSYTMGEMKSRGTLMSEKNGIPTVEGLSEGWYTVSVQTDKRDYFTIQVYVMPTREKEEGEGTK